MKIEIKGFLQEVGPVETANSGNKYQRVLIKVPGRRDDFDEPVSEDEIFALSILGQEKIVKTWEKHDDKNPWKKVAVKAFLNSRPVTKDGKTEYYCGLVVASIECLDSVKG